MTRVGGDVVICHYGGGRYEGGSDVVICHYGGWSKLVVVVKTFFFFFFLFVGSDVVICHYGGGRYEVEQKYTQFVDLATRTPGPRVDLLRNEAHAAASVWPASRYEVEQKYTQFVDRVSRSPGPRVDLLRLAAFLNEQERRVREGEPADGGSGGS
ncbi:hypothetical protein T484DRAFT_1785610 [Baffinella frigidus]|nr:hypothetical protein T484DRAFT_1785610 [Cryptophyta sp. CCMP2293]